MSPSLGLLVDQLLLIIDRLVYLLLGLFVCYIVGWHVLCYVMFNWSAGRCNYQLSCI